MTPGDSPAGVRRSSWRSVRGFVAAGTLLCLLAVPWSADADPTPEPTASGGSAAGVPATPAAPPSDANPSAAAATTPEPAAVEQAQASFRLHVRPTGTPVPGHYYEDIGRFAIAGSAGARHATATVSLYRRPAAGSTWTRPAETTADGDGDFSVSVPVTERGTSPRTGRPGRRPARPTR